MNSGKKLRGHTTWLDDELDDFVIADAFSRCQSISDYLRSLIEKRREEKMGKPVSHIGMDDLAGIMINVAKTLRGQQ